MEQGVPTERLADRWMVARNGQQDKRRHILSTCLEEVPMRVKMHKTRALSWVQLLLPQKSC